MFDHAYGALTPDLEAERAELSNRIRSAGSPEHTSHEDEPALPPPMRGQRMNSRWQN
jgi:hypothetical protein